MLKAPNPERLPALTDHALGGVDARFHAIESELQAPGAFVGQVIAVAIRDRPAEHHKRNDRHEETIGPLIRHHRCLLVLHGAEARFNGVQPGLLAVASGYGLVLSVQVVVQQHQNQHPKEDGDPSERHLIEAHRDAHVGFRSVAGQQFPGSPRADLLARVADPACDRRHNLSI
jgi:hypothetical protein